MGRRFSHWIDVTHHYRRRMPLQHPHCAGKRAEVSCKVLETDSTRSSIQIQETTSRNRIQVGVRHSGNFDHPLELRVTLEDIQSAKQFSTPITLFPATKKE